MANRLARVRWFAGALFIAAFAAGCSSSDSAAQAGNDVIDLRETDAVATEEAPAATTTIPIEDIAIIDEPAARIESDELVEASNWVARTFNDSQSVELVWSPVEGVERYRLLRLPTNEADFDAIATGVIEGAEEVYEGDDLGFIDRDVPTGEFLTYVLVADVDGGTTEPRWAGALTVDDVTPPAPITGLTATETADGVLLEWEPSPDDVEFASYSVSVLEEGGRLMYIGGGSDVGQVSFLDSDPFNGTRTYVVAAVDFHNNVSESAQIEVTLE